MDQNTDGKKGRRERQVTLKWSPTLTAQRDADRKLFEMDFFGKNYCV